MPDTSDSDTSSTDPTSGDGALSSLLGLQGVGSGYGVVTYTPPPTSSSTADDLSDLQSGSTGLSESAITSMFADTLGTVVALDSINAQTSNPATGYYKASNGQTYAIGTGPAYMPAGNPGGTLVFWLLIGLAAWWAAKEGDL
jgi:hypothetical protein